MYLSEVIQSYLADAISSLAADSVIFFSAKPIESTPDFGAADVVYVDLESHTASSAMQGHGIPRAAVVIDAPAYLDQLAVQRLLAGLRNAGVGTIITVSEKDIAGHREPWRIADYLALGFRRAQGSRTLSPAHVVYRYDLHDYKLTPSWLNARNWANPSEWGKQRW